MISVEVDSCASSRPVDDNVAVDNTDDDVAMDLRLPDRRRAQSPQSFSTEPTADAALNLPISSPDVVQSEVVTSLKTRNDFVTDEQAEVEEESRRLCVPLPLMVTNETLLTCEQDQLVISRQQQQQQQGRNPMRMLMRDWLLEQTANKSVPGLEWYNADKLELKIPWIHASKSGWSRDSHCKLFENWAVYTGKYRPNVDSPNPRRWKANFRCALNSLPDVKEVPELSKVNGEHGFKVYRFVSSPETTQKLNRDDGRGRTDWRALNDLKSQQLQQQQQSPTKELPLHQQETSDQDDVIYEKDSRKESNFIDTTSSSTQLRLFGIPTIGGIFHLTCLSLCNIGQARVGYVTTCNDDNVQNEIVVTTTDDLTTSSVTSDNDVSESDEQPLQIDFDDDEAENAKTVNCKDMKTNAGVATVILKKRRKPFDSTSGHSNDREIKKRSRVITSSCKERIPRRLEVGHGLNPLSPIVKSDHCYTLLGWL